ncbi:hypothetical protein JCM1840_004639 [Sporobolomyces johnsonii]
MSVDGPSPSDPPPAPACTCTPHALKVVVIGNQSTGKTALRRRFVSNAFSGSYVATIGCDFLGRRWSVPDQEGECSFQVWDTAGQERFRSLAPAFYRSADACILVFDYTAPASIESLRSWFDEFRTKCPVEDDRVARFCWVAVGCKSDAVSEERGAEVDREVRRVLDELVPRTKGAPPQPDDDHAPSTTTTTTTRERLPTDASVDVLPTPSASSPSYPSSSASSSSTPRKLRKKPTSNSFSTTTSSATGHSVYHSAESTLSSSSDPDPDSDEREAEVSDTDTATLKPSRRPRRRVEASSSSSSISSINTTSSSSSTRTSSPPFSPGFAPGAPPEMYLSTSPPHPPPTVEPLGHPSAIWEGGPFNRSEGHLLDRRGRGRDSGEEAQLDERTQTQVEGEEDEERRGESGARGCEGDGIEVFRTSAKTGDGVREVFDYIARRVLYDRKREEEERAASVKAKVGNGRVIRLNEREELSTMQKWRRACCS